MASKVNPYLKMLGTKIIMAFIFDGFDELPTSQQQQIHLLQILLAQVVSYLKTTYCSDHFGLKLHYYFCIKVL